MSIEVRRVEPPDDEELLEQWTRTDPGELSSVEALLPDDHPWQLILGMAEFVRVDPLETRMSEAVYDALLAVPGVTRVAREDTEVWLAWGTPDGGDLVRAAAAAIDPLVPEVEALRVQNIDQGRRQLTPAEPWRSVRGPLIACAVLAVLGWLILVDGLFTGDDSSVLVGAFAGVFFGVGVVVLGFRRP